MFCFRKHDSSRVLDNYCDGSAFEMASFNFQLFQLYICIFIVLVRVIVLGPEGSRRVVKLTWESVLSASNALKKNFLFNSYTDFIFCRILICPWSLKRPKKCLRERFRTH